MDRHPTLKPVYKRHRPAQRIRSSDTGVSRLGGSARRKTQADKLQRKKKKETDGGGTSIN